MAKNLFILDFDGVANVDHDNCYLILTHHNTFLGVDGITGRLLHCKLKTKNASFICFSADDLAHSPWLTPLTDSVANGFWEKTCLADFSLVRTSPTDSYVRFSMEQFFLCANAFTDTCELRTWAEDWETFELVPVSALLKAAAWNGRWVHHASNSVLEFVDLERVLSFRSADAGANGAALVDFSNVPPTTELVPSVQVSAYNPLIYYCVYGSYDFLQALALSLESLETSGQYRGTICVITDFAEEAVRRHVPNCYQDSLIILPMPVGPSWLGRYTISQPALSAFQPILYLDCDVICAQPIEPLLVDVVQSEKICLATEWREYAGKPNMPSEWGDYGHWFGKFLFDANVVPFSGPAAFGNSGIIGMRNAKVGEALFSNVITLMQQPNATLVLGDQPYLNFCLHVTNMGDFQLMDRYVQIIRRHTGLQANAPRTLIHVLNALTRGDKTSELRLSMSMAMLKNADRLAAAPQ